MTSSSSSRPMTQTVHAGATPDPTTGAVIPPIYATSTFIQNAPNVNKGYDYARMDNPTRQAFERAVAELEGGTMGCAFASGMAAISTVLELLPAGSHIVASRDVYGGTYRLFEQVRRLSADLRVTYADPTDLAAIQAATTPTTRMIWLEVMTNPLLQVPDIAALAAFARSRGILTVVDSTFASPWLANPLKDGADVVVHSATKYLGGHSDLIGGVAITRDAAIGERLRMLHIAVGGVAGPFDSFLMLRGVRTLGLRMERHSQNALALATWLESHPKVARVFYPGLPSHPQHALAQKLLPRGAGGVLSLVVKGGEDAARRFVTGTQLFALAVSLGGVESLIEQPSTMTHAVIPTDQREAAGFVPGLVRLAVGIEDIEDLKADLAQALG